MMAMDILGPLPQSTAGNVYVLVVADYFTRWMEVFPMPNQEAATVASKLVDEVFCRFAMPEQLHSDQGRQFEAEVISHICKLLQIEKIRTTPYHPQSDGLVERFNRTLLSMLSTTIDEHPLEWEDHLRKVCFAYNTSVQATTGYSSYFLMFGREARLPVDLLYQTDPGKNELTIPEYVSKLRTTLTATYEGVRRSFGIHQERQKEYYSRKIHGAPYDKGDLVWLFSPVVPRGRARKFHRPWTGPYRVVRHISEAVYRLQHTVSRKRVILHFDRLKRCNPGTRIPSPATPRQHLNNQFRYLSEPTWNYWKVKPQTKLYQLHPAIHNDYVNHPIVPSHIHHIEYGTYSLRLRLSHANDSI